MRYPLSDSSNDIAFDYTADGVRRSIEDSLQRLGVDSLDVAFVHNISPDFAYFPNGWEHNGIAKIGLSLPKTRSEHINGVARQGSDVRQHGRGVRSGASTARPSRAKCEFSRDYNRR